jgi:hypothetical protein
MKEVVYVVLATLGGFAFSDRGETVQKVSDTISVSSEGTAYTRVGSTTGLGAVFNNPADEFGAGASRPRDRFDDF